MSALTWPQALQNNLQILDQKEKEIANLLLSLDQGHIFNEWDPAGVNDEAKHSFFSQINELSNSYVDPVGLEAYIRRAKILLASAKAGENPFEGWRPEVPSGANLVPLTTEYQNFEEQGILEVGSCGFVLVAGGLGERLGYNGIKIELPSQTVTNVSYLDLYCQQILAMQSRYATNGHLLPVAIMVSEDTEHKTLELLEKHAFFGMQRSQITLMKQGKVPALLDDQAHIAMNTIYEVNAKPHGHGDVHSLMHSTGTAERWNASGTKWVAFFQDTNGLAFYTLPAMLGVSVQLGLEVNSLSIERAAKQSIGAIARLVHDDGREMTINVEYNQLDPLLRATTCAEGDVNDPATGFSPYPGNINQLLFRMDRYVSTLHTSQGVMPEFVNPKYADKARTVFKKPTRLECMMQDYPKLLPQGSKVGFTTAPAWLCYSPCKNNPVDAAASLASGIPASAPFTAECDQYQVWGELLRRQGAHIPLPAEVSILGVTGRPTPRLVFHPSFLLFPHELKERFPHPERVTLSETSTLIVQGDVRVESLSLNGSLSLSAVPNTRIVVKVSPDCVVENAGHEMVLLDEGGENALKETVTVTESDQMRGYVIVTRACQSVSTERGLNKASGEDGDDEEGNVIPQLTADTHTSSSSSSAGADKRDNDKRRRVGSLNRKDFVFDGSRLVESSGASYETTTSSEEK